MAYAVAHRKSDPTRFRELALQVVARFPASPVAAEALYNLADASSNPERREYLDRLRASYPVDRFPYSASAMNTLYAELTEPAEALALAREMVRALPAATVWPLRVAAQEAMTQAKTLVGGGKWDEAFALLEKAPPPSGNHGTTWTLLKAQAAAGAGRRGDRRTKRSSRARPRCPTRGLTRRCRHTPPHLARRAAMSTPISGAAATRGRSRPPRSA